MCEFVSREINQKTNFRWYVKTPYIQPLLVAATTIYFANSRPYQNQYFPLQNPEKSYVTFKKYLPHCETCHLLGVDKQPYCLSRVSFTDVHKKKGSLASLRYNLGTTYHVSNFFFVLHRIWAFRKKAGFVLEIELYLSDS